MRCRVGSVTLALLLSARDTAATETLASRATSLIVTVMRSCPPHVPDGASSRHGRARSRQCKRFHCRLQKHCNKARRRHPRSEEHTSELQSRFDLVCRLLLEK